MPYHMLNAACNMMGHGVLRLGIPPYMHLVETNTAVASSCLGADKCSTNYPGPTGLGASFNRTLWGAKGHHMGEEAPTATLTVLMTVMLTPHPYLDPRKSELSTTSIGTVAQA